MDRNALSQSELRLTAMAVGYVRLLADASAPAQTFLYNLLRLLPSLYTGLLELQPYGDDVMKPDDDSLDTGAILSQITEDQYNAVAGTLATLLGQYDTYLDTPAEDMRYSDTPVAVSLSEQLSDIYQTMADFAATIADAPADAVAEVMADLKYRFNTYLSDTICSALRAANVIYQSKELDSE